MKLHNTTVEKLIRMFAMHGGHREEWRLRHELSQIDLTVYAQQSSGNDILVPTESIKKH